jgi:hypothetical protein
VPCVPANAVRREFLGSHPLNTFIKAAAVAATRVTAAHAAVAKATVAQSKRGRQAMQTGGPRSPGRCQGN